MSRIVKPNMSRGQQRDAAITTLIQRFEFESRMNAALRDTLLQAGVITEEHLVAKMRDHGLEVEPAKKEGAEE